MSVENKTKKTETKTYFDELIAASNSSILKSRGDLFSKTLTKKLSNRIGQLEDEISSIEMSIMKAEDLNRLHTTSLSVAEDVDPDKWLSEIFELEKQKLILLIDLTVYQNMQDKYFGVDE